MKNCYLLKKTKILIEKEIKLKQKVKNLDK